MDLNVETLVIMFILAITGCLIYVVLNWYKTGKIDYRSSWLLGVQHFYFSKKENPDDYWMEMSKWILAVILMVGLSIMSIVSLCSM